MNFESDHAAVTYVEVELGAALPAGWTCHRRLQYRYQTLPASAVRLSHMEWKVAPAALDPQEVPSRDYLVRLSADRRVLTIVHGNSDAGGSAFNWMLQKATVLHVEDLQYHPLREFISHVLASNSPNTWGLS